MTNISLEKDILQQIKNALSTAITSTLGSSWNNPLWKMVEEIFNEHREELKYIVTNTLSDFLKDKEFKESLKLEMNHKLAKSCVSLLESQVDKALTSIKQDPMIRSRMVLALEKVITDNEKVPF